MSLRDMNLRYAALKLVAESVDQAMKAEKAAHLAELQESSDDSGAKSWTVTIGGAKVAGITLSQRAGGIKLADEAALVEAIEQVHPEMVETRLKPWAVKQLTESVVEVTGDGQGVTADGEMLPGFEESAPGAPYQSLRWDAKSGGKDMVADAIRNGELNGYLAGIGLPMLEKS